MLTAREAAVLRLAANGLTTREIGSQVHLSERAVKKVLEQVRSRFQLRNRTQAVAYALRKGLI
ncbi:response regulator transcription factor [Streptomyces sp. QH1-20]|uniref:response regulator transcription factor n=1 Tax=Streptomyces sp. QH1-20 TaxID=3240934 RepID=UPI0035195B1C